MSRPLRILIVFGVCAALLLGSVGWLTWTTLRVEREARHDAAFEENARLALWRMAEGHAHHLTFEAAALVIAFVLFGKWLEARARRATGGAVAALAALRPPVARILKDGVETESPVDAVKAGDVIVVRPGERISADGVIVSGRSEIDESMLTGESRPVMRAPGEEDASWC